MYLEDALVHFSPETKMVVFGFSLVSASFMKERIGIFWFDIIFSRYGDICIWLELSFLVI